MDINSESHPFGWTDIVADVMAAAKKIVLSEDEYGLTTCQFQQSKGKVLFEKYDKCKDSKKNFILSKNGLNCLAQHAHNIDGHISKLQSNPREVTEGDVYTAVIEPCGLTQQLRVVLCVYKGRIIVHARRFIYNARMDIYKPSTVGIALSSNEWSIFKHHLLCPEPDLTGDQIDLFSSVEDMLSREHPDMAALTTGLHCPDSPPRQSAEAVSQQTRGGPSFNEFSCITPPPYIIDE